MYSVIGKLTLSSNKKKKDTKIEIIVKNALEKMGIIFSKNYPYNRFVFNFYLPDYNFVIECQGDYWHGNSDYFNILNEVQIKNIKRDEIKKNYLDNNNFNYLFLWENEIHKNKHNLDILLWQHLKK